jgi:hypothetical protein
MAFSAQHLDSMHGRLSAFINNILQYEIMSGTCLWCIKEGISCYKCHPTEIQEEEATVEGEVQVKLEVEV